MVALYLADNSCWILNCSSVLLVRDLSLITGRGGIQKDGEATPTNSFS